MLDTNKDTTGKLPATSMDNLSLNLRHGRFTSHLSRQTTNISYCSGLLWSDQFQIIPCLAFPCLAWKLSLALISNQTRTRLEHQLSSFQTRNLNKHFGDFNFPQEGFSFFTEDWIKTFVSTFRNYFQMLKNSNFLKVFWTNKIFALPVTNMSEEGKTVI